MRFPSNAHLCFFNLLVLRRSPPKSTASSGAFHEREFTAMTSAVALYLPLPFPRTLARAGTEISSCLRGVAGPTSYASPPRQKEIVLGNSSVSVAKGTYSYDVEPLINNLSSFPPRGSIAWCLDVFRNKLSLDNFALVFKEFTQRGDRQRSLRLFKYMQRHIWCKPIEHIYTIMISLLGRENLLDRGREIFDEMNSQGVTRGVIPNVTTYGYLVETFKKLGKLDKVFELLKEMELQGNLTDVSA
ncbi:hypothetical protein MLD38_026155 [Melastoma candidum]|uniref:Uncharacterized protein n=1 Tax=Melastoma candidum TaxID=119954 RepID=A0ACB9NXL3_9MYRT|nr:hypothetical protein MLD38_026155 [Melastoma candidum]